MPRRKIYDDNAERQAAYRKRKGRLPTQVELADLAWGLHSVIEDAVEYNAFPLPHEILATRPDLTLRNLMRFFDVIYDPVRNPNGKIHRKSRFFEMEEEETTEKAVRRSVTKSSVTIQGDKQDATAQNI